VAINCFTFDALSCLSDDNTNLFFVTGCCFICHFATHRTKACPKCGYNILFCKRLDDPHCELLGRSNCYLGLIV
jgi:hypothetical protein